VKELRHVVGLSYKGFEEELLALFTTIEASHSEQALASCSSLGNRIMVVLGAVESKGRLPVFFYDAKVYLGM